MKLAMPEQMSAIDAYAINELGIPGVVLMENAALKVVDEASRMLGGLKGRRILLLAGKGNNGGDAFAAARHLFNKGSEVVVYLISKAQDAAGDAAVNMSIARRMGISIIELTDNVNYSEFIKYVDKAELVIDGLFGTGFRGELRGIARDMAETVNSYMKRVLAIDIPSGVNGESGEVPGICIRAEKTVTFCLPKTGAVLHPGCEFTGELVVADIGIPKEAIENQFIRAEVIDRELVSSMIPGRKNDSNKGDYGRVLLVSGSTGMTGSGRLCANAALRSGAGLVYLGVPASLSHMYSAALTEPIVVPLEDDGLGRLSGRSAINILEKLELMDAAAIGPGLSMCGEVAKAVIDVAEQARVPLVLDADALNAIAGDTSIFKRLKAPAVITPHPGEMARLTGLSVKEIQASRLEIAKKYAEEWGTVVVLKGARTVVALPDGSIYVNTCGNPGMATAGTGDVLTGIIAGLAAQGMDVGSAAAAGVYLHGKAGDAAAERRGMAGMVAGDLLEELPYTFKL